MLKQFLFFFNFYQFTVYRENHRVYLVFHPKNLRNEKESIYYYLNKFDYLSEDYFFTSLAFDNN